MLETKFGLFIPACEVAYIKDGIAYLYNGAIVEIVGCHLGDKININALS